MNELFKKVWNQLKEQGVERGDDISYFDLISCCEDVDVSVDDINIDEFSEKYDINIG